MTLRDSLSNWAALRRAASKPRTQRYHLECIETIVRLWPEKCDAPAAEIAEADVAAFVPRIEHYSATRFNGMVTLLKATLSAARSIRRRKVSVKERAVLSQAEFARLLRELDGRPQSHAGLIVRFLAHTGLRITEARKLRWRDIQPDCILAPGSVTKSGRPRAVPFVNGIRKTLQKLKRVASSGESVIHQAECKRSLQTACKRAGLPRLSHHDFRHLFATRCIQSGVDVPTVARWLGHQDGGALLGRVYFHLLDEHSRRMAAKVRI